MYAKYSVPPKFEPDQFEKSRALPSINDRNNTNEYKLVKTGGFKLKDNNQ